MEKTINIKEHYTQKAEVLYDKADKAQEEYDALVNRFDIKWKSGKKITESDVIEVLNGMQVLHDSQYFVDEGIEAEKKARGLK